MFFLFSTSLQPWAACWFTHTGSEAQRPQETVPSTLPFFSLPLVSPPSVVLSLPPGAISPFTEQDLTEELPPYSFLIPNKTLVWRGCYSHMILWHTKGPFPCAKTQIHIRMSKRHHGHWRYLTTLIFYVLKLSSEIITAIRALICKICTPLLIKKVALAGINDNMCDCA